MIPKTNIVNALKKLKPMSPRSELPLRPLLLSLCLLTLTLTSWTGCKTRTPRVISADQLEQPLSKGQQFTAPDDGMFMNSARYMRYRKRVADRILEEQSKAKK